MSVISNLSINGKTVTSLNGKPIKTIITEKITLPDEYVAVPALKRHSTWYYQQEIITDIPISKIKRVECEIYCEPITSSQEPQYGPLVMCRRQYIYLRVTMV